MCFKSNKNIGFEPGPTCRLLLTNLALVYTFINKNKNY